MLANIFRTSRNVSFKNSSLLINRFCCEKSPKLNAIKGNKNCKDFQNEEGKHLTILSEKELYEKRAAEKLKMKQEKEIEELANKIKEDFVVLLRRQEAYRNLESTKDPKCIKMSTKYFKTLFTSGKDEKLANAFFDKESERWISELFQKDSTGLLKDDPKVKEFLELTKGHAKEN